MLVTFVYKKDSSYKIYVGINLLASNLSLRAIYPTRSKINSSPETVVEVVSTCLACRCTGEVHRRRLVAAGRRRQLGGGEETPDSTSPTLQRRHIPLIIVAFTIFSRMSSAVRPPSIESHDGLSSSTPKFPQKHMMK